MKRAVVLGGGGSRGSYQIGVWKALRELDYPFDIVCGTSVGSLNAALMAQGDFDKALELWGKITTGDVLDLEDGVDWATLPGRRRALREFVDRFVREGGVDPAPLERMLREIVDEDRVRRSAVEFGLVTVEFPSLKPLVLTGENIPEGELCDYLMASSACYPAMKSRHIADKQYIDGGYYSNLPVEIALERGADEIITVDLDAIGMVRPLKNPGKTIIPVRSRWDLGPFLVFEPATAARNIALGYNDAMKAFGRLEGEWYAFFPGEAAAYRERLAGALLELTQNLYREAGMEHGRWVRGMAREAVAKVLGGRPGRVKAQTVLGWAEAAGRILELEPGRVYRLAEFNREVARAAVLLPELPSDAVSALAALKADRPADAFLKDLDKKALLAYIRSLLAESLRPEAETPGDALALFAAITPEVFMGALYVFGLEKQSGEERI